MELWSQKERSKTNFPFKQVHKIWKNARKSQIIMAAPKVNSQPQEANVFALKPPYYQ